MKIRLCVVLVPVIGISTGFSVVAADKPAPLYTNSLSLRADPQFFVQQGSFPNSTNVAKEALELARRMSLRFSDQQLTFPSTVRVSHVVLDRSNSEPGKSGRWSTEAAEAINAQIMRRYREACERYLQGTGGVVPLVPPALYP